MRRSNGVAYAAGSTGTATLDQLRNVGRYNRWLFDRVAPAVGSRVLEIGTGCGTMTEFLLDRELVVGIDVVEPFIQDLQRRYSGRANAVFSRHDISSSIGDLQHYRLDSAVSFNVFEHIEDDETALRNVHRLLVPGGRLGLVVPAHERLRGRFDNLIGHCRRYSVREMGTKLERAGFAVEQVAYSNLVGALGWLVHVTWLGRHELGGTGLFDKLVPALAAVERVIRPPFGLSVVAIARK